MRYGWQRKRLIGMKTEVAQRISGEMNDILARLNSSIQIVGGHFTSSPMANLFSRS